MDMNLWIVRDCNESIPLAICTSKAKAIELLKEIANDPCCERPIADKCLYDEEDECTYLENEYGWRNIYDIFEAWTDDWINRM